MKRLLARLLVWPVLILVIVAVFIPLTETGSKLVLDSVGRLPGLEIEYEGGTLAGELEVRRVAWAGDSITLELSGVMLELSPACLWRSRVCFLQLDAQHLEIVIIPGPDAKPAPPAGDDLLVEFPVALEAKSLRLSSLVVKWEGGEWHQGSIQGEAYIDGSILRVDHALIQQARLTLEATGESREPGEKILLPEFGLPLELQVGELLLEQGSWDLYGEKGEIQSLLLNGQWQRKNLRLAELQLRSVDFGEWRGAGDIQFSGQWPVNLEGTGVMPAIEGWPGILERGFEVKASGNLEALTVQADVAGGVALSAGIELNTLDPQLPFQLRATADWADSLAVSELLELPDELSGMTLLAPVQLDASGDLRTQDFQLRASATVPAYPPLNLQLAGSHTAGRVAFDDLRLRDAGDTNTLWARGELDYGDTVRLSALLESSGLDLPPLGDFGSGRIEGQLQLLVNASGEYWDIAVAEADVQGEVNGLPARISGHGGIDSELRLLASDLRADMNGARLLLLGSADRSQPARVELALDDLGLWLPDTGGTFSLQASADSGWEEITLSGSLTDIRWQNIKVAGGDVEGSYRSAGAGDFSLGVVLADAALGDIELGSAELSARGSTTEQTLALSSAGDIEGVLELEGKVDSGGEWVGQLAATSLQTAKGKWHLRAPVAVNVAASLSQLHLEAHCWHFRQTRVCPGKTIIGEEGSASLALDGDLEEFSALLPRYLKLQGAVAAEFKANWAPAQPLALDGKASGRDILFTRHYGQDEKVSVAWQQVDLQVHNGAQGLLLGAGLYRDQKRVAGIDLRLPADRKQPLSGEVELAQVQLTMLAPFAPTLSELRGELRGSLHLAGTIEKPLVQGTLYLADGQFAVVGNPTEFSQMELQLDAHGDRATVQGSGLLGGGQLSFSGDLTSDPDWLLQLSLEGERNEILLPPYTQMLVSENLQLQLTPGLLDLKGDILVHEGVLEHERLPEGSVGLSDDVVEVDDSGNVIYKTAPFDTSINVSLVVRDKFKLLGDTVNATLGGDLQLRQSRHQPLQVFGNLNVIGGELRAYQQRLRIQRGTIAFVGTPDNPDLDVRAQRHISTDNIIVGIQLQGTLKQPQLEVFSEPPMSHGEAMSYLVRGRAPDSGAGNDGVAMALTMGTGLVNQTALVEELNRIPGISQLEFGAEGSTEEDTAATVGGYIGERLYLSYGLGVYEPINVLTARLYLKARLWLEVVSRLENSVDLYYAFDIK